MRGGEVQRVAVGIGRHLVVAQPQMHLGRRAEQQPQQLIVLDPLGGGDGTVEQLARPGLLTAAAGGDGEAAQDPGSDPFVAGPLRSGQRLLPHRLRLGEPGVTEGHVAGTGQGAGERHVVVGADRQLPCPFEVLTRFVDVAAQQHEIAESG